MSIAARLSASRCIADQIARTGPGPSYGVFSVSSQGVLVYGTGIEATTVQWQLVWRDRVGKTLQRVGEPAAYSSFVLSPDGNKGAAVIGSDIWIVDLARGVPTRFTFESGFMSPVWSPDATRIAFGWFRTGSPNLYQKSANGLASEERILTDVQQDGAPVSWSPDGRFLLYLVTADGVRFDVWAAPLYDDRKPFSLLASSFNESWATFSPDGRWIAYQSNESGRDEVYVIPFSGSLTSGRTAGKWQVSARGGETPTWRGDGQELFYVSPAGTLMATVVDGRGATFTIGDERPLFTIPAGAPVRLRYAAASDGQRFLTIAPTEPSTPSPETPPTVVVVNWTAALEK